MGLYYPILAHLHTFKNGAFNGRDSRSREKIRRIERASARTTVKSGSIFKSVQVVLVLVIDKDIILKWRV
jgi:hypothetical protein